MNSNDLFSIAGKRTVITGGTAGIGLGVAAHFSESGADVVITGRRESGGAIADEIGVKFARMDVSDNASVATAMDEAGGMLGGKIDVLILNAGVGPPSHTIDELDANDLKRTFDVNVYGVVFGMQEGLRYMNKGGSVIITSSPAATAFRLGMSAYGSSKAAVNALAKIWAIELGPRDIRVNAVLPGIVETEMAFYPDGLEEEIEMIRTLTTTGKLRQPKDLAPVYRFLASVASDTLSGAIVACDDGLSSGYSKALLEKAFG